MPFKYKWEGPNIIAVFEDVIVYMDFVKLNQAMYGDIRFSNMKFQLVDITRATSIDVTEKEAKVLGVLDKSSSRWNDHIKMAFVISDDWVLGLIEVYKQSLKETKWEVKVFKDFNEAHQWCNS